MNLADTKQLVNRAYSVLTIKSIDEDKRTFEGIATTPTADRGEDIVEPKGAVFKLPIPLLWQHGKGFMKDPIGAITSAKVTADGISVKGYFAKFSEPQSLKDDLDRVWVLVKSGLVRGLSIGFRPLDWEAIKNSFGVRHLRWEWLELSAVNIPMQAEANITTIKQLDTSIRAALGAKDQGKSLVHSPGASGHTSETSVSRFSERPKGKIMHTSYQERLQNYQEQRGEKATRIKELADGCDSDFEQLADNEISEYRTLTKELDDIDVKIGDVKGAMRAINGATEVSTKPTETRTRIQMGEAPKVEKGIGFARYAMAIGAGRGSISDALQYAKSKGWYQSTPGVEVLIKASAGTTLTGNWAETLGEPAKLVSEFIELLRPATIIGRVEGWRRVPFNVKIPVVTGGSLVGWVAQTAPKPVGEMTLDMVTIPRTKVAGIIVLSDELVLDGTPSAEATVRDDLVSQTAQFLDEQLLDSTVSAVAGTNPASLTNGLSATASTGNTEADLRANLVTLTLGFGDIGLAGAVWVTTSGIAMGIAGLTTSLGQPAFPGVTATGGTLMGLPLIISDSVPHPTAGAMIVLMKPNEIFLADDGAVRLDASNQATLDMAGGSSPTFNLWQRNCIAIKAERFIHWQKRRANAVAYISGAAYAPVAP